MPKKPKPHLTPFERRVLEYLDRHGWSPASRIGRFLWPLTACRGYPVDGGPNKAAFAAGNLLGKVGHKKGIVDRYWPKEKYSSPEWHITTKGWELLRLSRAAQEDCAIGLTEKVAELLTVTFGLKQKEAEDKAWFVIQTSYVRFSSAGPHFSADKARRHLAQFEASGVDKREAVKTLKLLIEEEDRKVKIC